MDTPHIVVIGGGFAGVECVKQLRRAPARITLVDRQNHHLFQPLLYQVATAALSPANIAAPIREIFARDRHVQVMLDEVTRLDPATRTVRLASGHSLSADYLVIAAGLRPVYFGNDRWRPDAPPLKTIDDAVEIRRRFLLAFEAAEFEDDAAAQRRYLTFVVIGAGPTGVEMAGALAELSRKTIRSEFRRIDPATARIVLVEGEDRVLPGFHPDSSNRALRDLERLGVEVLRSVRVAEVDDTGVTLTDGERIDSGNVIWAAGVGGSELGTCTGAPLTRDGRVEVEADLTVPGCPDVFVTGDLARVADPRTGGDVPGVAPAAIQMGRFVGRVIRRETIFARTGRACTLPARVPLRRQGHARHHRPQQGGRRGVRTPLRRLAGVRPLGRRPHLLPDRIPQSHPDHAAVDVALHRLRPRGPAHHRR